MNQLSFSAPSLIGRPFTSAANTLESMSVFPLSGIASIVWMAFRTMRFVDVAVAASKALSSCDWFKVGRVAASSVSAKMAEVKAIGDWADQQFVGQPVDKKFGSWFVANSAAYPNFSVAVGLTCASPDPTILWRTLNYFWPESLFKRFRGRSFWPQPGFPITQV